MTSLFHASLESNWTALEHPRGKDVDVIAKGLSKEILDKVWEVLGGGEKGGIIVRTDQHLTSAIARDRLATGALVRELAIVGDRLHYQLLDGDGPINGWVSFKSCSGADLLTKLEGKSDMLERLNVLMRRLAMLPMGLRDISYIDAERCLNVTDKLYGRNGCLLAIPSDLWRQKATVRNVHMSWSYPAFPAGDRVLESLVGNVSLKPLKRVFPRPPSGGRLHEPQSQFVDSLDAAAGLLPDSTAVAYFLADTGVMLRGAVRFGPQATGSMNRQVRAEEGLTGPSSHGGATSCVIYDAAMYLARLSFSAAATPKTISITLGQPCPLLQTLEIQATADREYLLRSEWASVNTECAIRVVLKFGNYQIASATLHFVWDPQCILDFPDSLPRKRSLVHPCIDWVPRELAFARFPTSFTQQGWDAESHAAAAFDAKNAMRFPTTCAPRYSAARISDLKTQGCKPIVRANRPLSGGPFRNDLAYAAGLAPAAISFTKWYTPFYQFEGMLKFGPQASDAWFLEDDGHAAPDMSLSAHYGIVLAALDEWAAHIPRISPGAHTVTWKLEIEAHYLVPIGHELEIRSAMSNKTSEAKELSVVQADILEDGRLLVSAEAVMHMSH